MSGGLFGSCGESVHRVEAACAEGGQTGAEYVENEAEQQGVGECAPVKHRFGADSNGGVESGECACRVHGVKEHGAEYEGEYQSKSSSGKCDEEVFAQY